MSRSWALGVALATACSSPAERGGGPSPVPEAWAPWVPEAGWILRADPDAISLRHPSGELEGVARPYLERMEASGCTPLPTGEGPGWINRRCRVEHRTLDLSAQASSAGVEVRLTWVAHAPTPPGDSP